jgi:1-acyl-sn-glycerol-3-phosphate acyltransferase
MPASQHPPAPAASAGAASAGSQDVPGSRILYPGCRLLARAVLALGFRTRYRGREHVPGAGPLILAANHQSFLDPFLLGASIRLRPRYLVYYIYLRMPIIGTVARFFGGLPVGHGPPARSLKSARSALDAGAVVAIFPEGKRSPDGRVLPFQRGFAHLARVTGTPVLPAAILGAHQAWPPGRAYPAPSRIEVIFGTPRTPPAVQPDTPAAARRQADREFAEGIRRAILDLAADRLQAAGPTASGAGPIGGGPVKALTP